MWRSVPCFGLFVFVCLFAIISFLPAADPPQLEYTPHVAKASDEGQKAIKQFRMPAGVDTW